MRCILIFLQNSFISNTSLFKIFPAWPLEILLLHREPSAFDNQPLTLHGRSVYSRNISSIDLSRHGTAIYALLALCEWNPCISHRHGGTPLTKSTTQSLCDFTTFEHFIECSLVLYRHLVALDISHQSMISGNTYMVHYSRLTYLQTYNTGGVSSKQIKRSSTIFTSRTKRISSLYYLSSMIIVN